MSTSPKLHKMKIVDMSPNVPAKYKHLLPTVMRPYQCSFQLDNVDIAIANGIRRAILSEVPVKRLTFQLDDFSTNNPHMNLPHFILTRIQSIPIDQSVSLDTTFSLDYGNSSHQLVMVNSNEFTSNKKTKPLFDETIPIISLEPGKFVKIEKMTVEIGYEYTHGTFAIADGVLCKTLDYEPYNMYTGKGVSSSVSDPRSHLMQFDNNGNINHITLITLACDEIIRRLKIASELLYTLEPFDDYFKLFIANETDTIGNIIMKRVCDIFPEIPAISYRIDSINKELSIIIRTASIEESVDRLSVGIKSAIEIINSIKKQLK